MTGATAPSTTREIARSIQVSMAERLSGDHSM